MRAGEANKEFFQTIVLESLSNVNRQDIMCVSTLRNVELGNELIVDYDSSVHFVPSI